MSKMRTFSPNQLKKAERMVVGTLVTVLALSSVAVVMLGGKTFWQHVLSVPLTALLLVVVASLLENVLRIYRYRIFADALKLPVPWWWLVTYYMAGMALLPTPGKVGVALRLWLLKQHHGILYRRSTPVLVMDVLTDTLAMMAIIAIGIISLGSATGATLGLLLLTTLIGGVMMVLWAPRVSRNLVKMLYNLTGRRTPRLFATLLTVLRLLNGMMGAKVLLKCTALSFTAWALFGYSLSYMVISMGYPVDWNLGGFALCAGTILGFLTMAPAGVGGAEASMTAIFHAFGAPLGVAFIVTMMGRLMAMWIPVGIGFIALPFAMRGPGYKKKS